jgi:hypothetical protein
MLCLACSAPPASLEAASERGSWRCWALQQVGELHLFHVLFHLDCVAYKPAAALPAGLKEFYANTLALPGVRPAPAPAPPRSAPPRSLPRASRRARAPPDDRF